MSDPPPDLVDPVDLQVESRGRRKTLTGFGRLVLRSTRLVWRTRRWLFLGLLALQIAAAALLASQVMIVERVLQAILDLDAGGQTAALIAPVLLLAALTAGTALIGALRTNMGRYLAEAVSRRTWHEVLDAATGVSLRHFEAPAFYDRLQRVQASAPTKPFQVTQALLNILGGLAASLGVGAVLVGIHPILLPILLLSGVPLLYTNRRESALEFAFNVDQTPRMRELFYLTYLLTGRDEAKEIRAFDSGRSLVRRFDRHYRAYQHDLSRLLRKRSALSLLGNLGSALFLVLALLTMVWLITQGQVSLAQAGAAIVAIRLLQTQIQTLLHGVQATFEAGLFLQDVDQFMTAATAGKHEEDGAAAPSGFEAISTAGLRFRYPGSDAEALAGVDVQIRRGQIVALVGENGSGKTTLAKILAGLYDPTGGDVSWDGTDTRTYARSSLRSRVAVIFQDFVRYAFTAEENVAIGRDVQSADAARVRHAARRAGAAPFLEKLPHGYETRLSRMFKGGRDLSGGQWQRVAIARAFYRDVPLMILDEPTAALDPRAESELFESLREVLAGRTAVFISHRFSSVRSADVIYVLDQGRVIEAGSHEALMARGGRYAELFRLQAAAYLDTETR